MKDNDFSQLAVLRMTQDSMQEFPLCTRVEVIDQDGRLLVLMNADNVMLSIQDDGRTVKIFLVNEDE